MKHWLRELAVAFILGALVYGVLELCGFPLIDYGEDGYPTWEQFQQGQVEHDRGGRR